MAFFRSWIVVLALAVVFDLSLGSVLADPPTRDCGAKPTFGDPALWSYDQSCALSYQGNLEIPPETKIVKQFYVRGSLRFIEPIGARSSLIFNNGASITTDNAGAPLSLPRLPISVVFFDLKLPTNLVPLIKTETTTINTTVLPTVAYSFNGNPSGFTITCATKTDEVKTPTSETSVFGFSTCKVVYPPKKSEKKLIIIIVATVLVAVAILVVGVIVFCICRHKKSKEESQVLLGDSKYINGR